MFDLATIHLQKWYLAKEQRVRSQTLLKNLAERRL